jgi:reactive chlorine resistance protein C
MFDHGCCRIYVLIRTLISLKFKLSPITDSSYVLDSTSQRPETVGIARVAIDDEGTGGAAMSSARSTRSLNTYLTGDASSRVGSLAGRYGLVIVIAWFAGMKFTTYEAQGISPLVANSPFLSWAYHLMSINTFSALLGTAELITALLLALKPWSPKLSVLGGAFAVLFFLGTLSFMLTTPGIGEASAGGFPVLSATGEFLMKDIALLGLSIWALADSVDTVAGRDKAHTVSVVK